MVQDARRFSDVARQFLGFCQGCDFGGYNVRYDLKVLCAEFERLDMKLDISGSKIVDPYILWMKLDTRTLSDAMERFCPGTSFQAHDPQEDIGGTESILLAQLEEFKTREDFPSEPTVEDLHKLAYPDYVDLDRKFVMRDDKVCFNFGKHHGKPATNENYLRWMLNGDFSSNTKDVCRRLLQDL